MIRVWMMTIGLVFAIGWPAGAQVLQGEWVQQTQQRIEAVRKTDVRVIVLDENDRPAENAHVRIEQLRHDFHVGFTLRDTQWPDYDDQAPLWRCFNAVAMDSQTGWSRYDDLGAEGLAGLERMIHRARQQGLHVRWGGGVSADLARNPDWLAEVSADNQQLAVETHAGNLMRRFGWQVDQLDLYTHIIDHDLLERQFGLPMVRQLYEEAKAGAPVVPRLGVRVHDRLTGERLQELVRTITDWRQAFVPIDFVAIEQRTHGSLVHGPIERALTWLGELDVSLVLVGLEVGGASETAAALNMETLLRTLFAEPNVEGIWFGAMTPDRVGAPYAQLFDDDGELTRTGRLVDNLFADLWWSDETLRTDELGNARARVFAGTYRVTAVLPDERTLEAKVHLPLQEDGRIVVLQPMRR